MLAADHRSLYQSGLLEEDDEKQAIIIEDTSKYNASSLYDSDIKITSTTDDDEGVNVQHNTNPNDDIFRATSYMLFKWYSFLNTLDQKDKHYTSYIQQLEFGCLFEMFMLIPTVAYSFIGISILILIHSIVFKSILYFINSFLCLIINQSIKNYVGRNRPRLDNIGERMVDLDGVLLVKRSSSMPSGDTAQATVFACSMIYTMCYYFNVGDITWWWFLVTIPICGFERIYFGKHWIGDTLCGAIEGVAICAFICGAFGPYLFF